MRLGHQLGERFVERDADRDWIGTGAANAEHLQSRRHLRLPAPPADALCQVEDALNSIELVEHRRAPAEADRIVAAGAEGGFERLDRFNRVELFVAVSRKAGRSFRFEVVG